MDFQQDIDWYIDQERLASKQGVHARKKLDGKKLRLALSR